MKHVQAFQEQLSAYLDKEVAEGKDRGEIAADMLGSLVGAAEDLGDLLENGFEPGDDFPIEAVAPIISGLIGFLHLASSKTLEDIVAIIMRGAAEAKPETFKLPE